MNVISGEIRTDEYCKFVVDEAKELILYFKEKNINIRDAVVVMNVLVENLDSILFNSKAEVTSG